MIRQIENWLDRRTRLQQVIFWAICSPILVGEIIFLIGYLLVVFWAMGWI